MSASWNSRVWLSATVWETTACMAHMSEAALTKALTLMDQYDEEKAAQVEKLENRIDHFEDKSVPMSSRLQTAICWRNDSAKCLSFCTVSTILSEFPIMP